MELVVSNNLDNHEGIQGDYDSFATLLAFGLPLTDFVYNYLKV